MELKTDQTESIQRAINFIEEHLDDKINCATLAKKVYFSNYHFCRMFGIVCGITPSEYIRCRRLSRAASDLLSGQKVLDVAIKYGYESSESFSRAFQRFHGVLPSQVKRGYPAKTFLPISIKAENKGTSCVNCTVEYRPSKILVGFKKRFCGAPYGEQRLKQEHEFYSTTRAGQWLLLGASNDHTTEYAVVTNFDEDGYDFYIAYEVDEWTRIALFDPSIAGMDLTRMGLEVICLPERLCAVFPTDKSKNPIAEYTDIRKCLAEWIPISDYRLADVPEVVELHWRIGTVTENHNRYIEITIPVEPINLH